MAALPITLVIMAALATLATLGLFYNFDDAWTGVFVGFAAAFLWAILGMSSFDVIVATTTSTPLTIRSESVLPLVYMGIGMAFISFIFALNDLVHALGSEATSGDASSEFGR